MQVKKGHLAFPELLRGRQTSGGDNRSGCRKNGESDMIWYFFFLKKNTICFSENWVCTGSETRSMKGLVFGPERICSHLATMGP